MPSATSVCKHCGHKITGRVRICPLCGGDIKPEVTTGDAACPRCSCELEHVEFRNKQLGKCPQCDGLWLGIQDFETLTTECDVYRDENVEPVYARPAHTHAEAYLPCANCGKLMTRRNFAGISGVKIDMCRDCGYWLDAGELEMIRSFIASGGLDKAQDAAISKQSSQIGSLETRVDYLEFMEKYLDRYNPKRWYFRKK